MGSADAKTRKKRSLIWNYILFLEPTILLFTAIEIIPLLMGDWIFIYQLGRHC